MERAPRAHIRISEMLGRKPRDVKTPEAWWETWHAQTHPAFPRSFLLAGREGLCSALAAALALPARHVITVLGPSSTEALAVVCASLVSDDSEAADKTGTRALVVSDAHVWDRLVDSDHALVLIPTFEDADVSAALRRGHHVVVPVADDVPPRGIAVEVPPLDRWKAAEALLAQDNALSRDAADRYAGHAGRNLISFRRTIAVTPAIKRPPWAEGPAAGRLAPLVLAGSWSDDAEGDRTAIAMLTGRDYSDVEGDLAAWSALEDPPLYRSGRIWRLVSKDDTWNLLSPLITRTHLSRFHELAAQVLHEPDPALDAEPQRRFMANIIGQPRTHSVRGSAPASPTRRRSSPGMWEKSASLTVSPGNSMLGAWYTPSPAISTPTPRGAGGNRSQTCFLFSPKPRRNPSSMLSMPGWHVTSRRYGRCSWIARRRLTRACRPLISSFCGL